MKSPLQYVRKNILDLKPYSTARDEFMGGDISVWADANENPFNNGVNRYPDPHQQKLKEVIAALKHVDVEQIFLGGAGSDEAIDLTYRIFCEPREDNAIAISPSYGVYEVCAAINNVELRKVQLREDFSLPMDELLSAADSRSRLMWICSPNNPTGNAFSTKDLTKICEEFDGMVIIDEAYVDFSPEGSMVSEIADHPNLIVLQTLSKAWGMAGLRMGMAIANPAVAELYGRVKYPYNINGPTQKAVIDRIRTTDITSMTSIILSERKRMEKELSKLDCVVKIYHSDANFLLVKMTDADAAYEFLIRQGIIVRNRSRLPGCESTLRITVGTPDENSRIIEALKYFSSGKDIGNGSMLPAGRRAEVIRNTSETKIMVKVDLNGGGTSEIDTGLKFFDHMLWQLPHHAGISLIVKCIGDLDVDEHHTMEDVAITLGEAISIALGDKAGIERYGFVLPMDESRAMVLIDLGGRTDLVWQVDFTREYIGDTPTEMYSHFFKSLAASMKCNLHVKASGENNHHLIESVFKAFARALRMAIHRNPFSYDLPTSKGMI